MKYLKNNVVWGAIVFILLIPTYVNSKPLIRLNTFDVTDALIPTEQIRQGGPPKDGIPSIDRPKFVSQSHAGFMAPNDLILGVFQGNAAKAYPIKILNHHEVVNDFLSNQPIAVTYCPLCASGIVFKRDVQNNHLEFGVSGLLYNSDVLLYDRKTQSLWSQLMGMAISGPLKGSRLETLDVEYATWHQWKKAHPETLVLSTDTGYRRNYNVNPYQSYESSPRIYFPVATTDKRYPLKTTVLGIESNGIFKAYPFPELSLSSSPLSDQINNRHITLHFDGNNRTAKASAEDGLPLYTTISYWFAWIAFHPETQVFRAQQ